jgi:hypothetical protein
MGDADQLKCGACLAHLVSGDAFCSACGQKAVPVILVWQCPDCAARYADDAQFCMNDGARLAAVPIALSAANGVAERCEAPSQATGFSQESELTIDTFGAQSATEVETVDAEALHPHFVEKENSALDSAAFGTAAFAQHIGNFKAQSRPFWERHKVLSIMTIAYLIALMPVAAADRAEGARAIMVMIGLPLFAAWFVALSDSERVLAGVGRMDGWFVRSKNYMGGSNGKIRRWIMYPLLWVADQWVGYALKTEDRFSSAALRVFGYIITFALIAMLAYFVIALVVVIALLGITILALSFFMDGPSTGGKIVTKGGGKVARSLGKKIVEKRGGKIFAEDGMILGRRGDKIYRGAGGLFGSEDLVGRVDEDGNIYEGTGGIWGHERKIGRIDEGGRIHEGTGGLWGYEERVGRIDDEGKIHEGSGGLWGHDDRVGRIDKDGTIYEGPGGLLGSEDRSGRSKK